MSKIKRRDLLAGAASGAAVVAASSMPNPAYAKGRRRLKCVTTWPKNYPGLGMMPERISQRVKAMSDGQIDIRVYGAGELVGAFEAFDAVSTGAADMYHGAEYYWQGKSKAFNFFTAVPFGLTATEMNAWLYHGGGNELWDELSKKFNIKAFPAGNTGVQMGGWYNKQINTLEDWKGLKIRMPGLGGEVVRRLGAAATALPGGEIFPALQSGAIDASEWVGPWNDLAFGFYKVVKHYYWPGFHEPGSTLALGINRELWDDMTPSEQMIIQTACAAIDEISLAEYNMQNGRALKTLINDHGVKLERWSDEILAQIGTASGEVLREAAASDEMTKRVYDSFMSARTEVGEWSKISDRAFWEARDLPFEF